LAVSFQLTCGALVTPVEPGAKSQELKAAEEKTQTGGRLPTTVSFPMRSSRSAGGAGVSTGTFGTIFFANFFFANFAESLAIFAVKSS
jgi:hypothetical protein